MDTQRGAQNSASGMEEAATKLSLKIPVGVHQVEKVWKGIPGKGKV